MNAVIAYIISFLIDGDKKKMLASQVGYTADTSQFHKYRVVIIPSPFFKSNVYGTDASMPVLPLNEIEGVPLLFGTPEIEWMDGVLIVQADIVASAYFLLTRYEEIRRRDVRDEHGRFPGKESLPYRAGFIHRPVVDEYGALLRGWLRQAGAMIIEPERKIRKIWLTHDVDAPFFCRTLRSVLRETVKGKGLRNAWKIFKGPLTADPYYTFPWLIEQDEDVRKAVGKDHSESVFFLKAGGKAKQDKPRYHFLSKDMHTLLSFLHKEQVSIGLHSSYDAGKKPSYILSELNTLKKFVKKGIIHNRHHFLAAREPDDFEWLERARIVNDFTMGYADVSGFRLGTCRPVRWINPVTKRLSHTLVLHPLTVMDGSLSESKYMNMEYDEALAYCYKLIDQVANMHGEVVLLWHNTTVSESNEGYHRTLYTALLNYLKQR